MHMQMLSECVCFGGMGQRENQSCTQAPSSLSVDTQVQVLSPQTTSEFSFYIFLFWLLQTRAELRFCASLLCQGRNFWSSCTERQHITGTKEGKKPFPSPINSACTQKSG